MSGDLGQPMHVHRARSVASKAPMVWTGAKARARADSASSAQVEEGVDKGKGVKREREKENKGPRRKYV